MLNRRHVLALGGALGGAMLIPGAQASQAASRSLARLHRHGTRSTASGASSAVSPFSVRMPVPPVLAPAEVRSDTDIYRIDIKPAQVEIIPGLTTPALTYGGGFVGPTIRARTGRRAQVIYRNLHDMPANVHLHGGHVPASSDGHPMDLIEPGQERTYDYPNQQRGATLWYHDHSHHMEAEHVYRGLHGFYLIDDDSERWLNLPTGSYDVPIMIRDAEIDETGQLVFGEPFNRTVILANGKPTPYFPVAARKYRFRLLNTATERFFHLDLGGVPMIQIGSDGGLLPAPVTRTDLRLTPGERVDIVVDFSRHPLGTQLVLADETGPVLRFDVVRYAFDSSWVPNQLRSLPALCTPTVTRDVVIGFDLSGTTGGPVGLINGQPFDPNRVDFQVAYGATEIWRVSNADAGTPYGDIPHTFHMHLAQFRVLDRDGAAPTPDDAGLKDTISIPAGTTARVQATFKDYVGRYVYHCHMLEHSSFGMMAQMEIIR